MTYKIPSPKGAKNPMASVFYMSCCLIVHVLTSITLIAKALYVTKLLYNSSASMVTDAIDE